MKIIKLLWIIKTIKTIKTIKILKCEVLKLNIKVLNVYLVIIISINGVPVRHV
jgi:hypothetical protein